MELLEATGGDVSEGLAESVVAWGSVRSDSDNRSSWEEPSIKR